MSGSYTDRDRRNDSPFTQFTMKGRTASLYRSEVIWFIVSRMRISGVIRLRIRLILFYFAYPVFGVSVNGLTTRRAPFNLALLPQGL